MEDKLERMKWAAPSLVFSSFMSSASEGRVGREPLVGLCGPLEGKQGGVHNPESKMWADCPGSRKEERSTRKRMVPTREPGPPKISV